MFDAMFFVAQEKGLALPDDYDLTPIVDLARKAFNAGADQGADASEASPLVEALRLIIRTTTDPVAKITAERALLSFEVEDR